jgi:radical SAM protein with 4Fe4S-binding SPASM domain
MCSTGKDFASRKKGKMSFEEFKKIIDETGRYLYEVGPFNLGEPLLHEDIFKMISYVQNNNIATILSTNGTLMTKDVARQIIDSGLEKLIISMDAATEETYQKNRPGGDFNTLKENIKMLMAEKKKKNSKTPFVIAQMVVMKNNEGEIEEFKKLSKELNVDSYVLSTYWGQLLGSSAEEKNTINFYSTRDEFKNLRRNDYLVKDTCRWAWSGSVINWDGTVVPCCYDYKETYAIGNVFDKGLKRLWNNKLYKQVRREIKKGRRKIPLCAICPCAKE